MNIEKTILETLDDNLEKTYAERQKQIDNRLNKASQAGWVLDCKRRLILLRLCPEKAEPMDMDAKRRLEEGIRQEKLMREEMVQAGFELRPAKRMIDEKLQLTGEVEDMLNVNGDTYPLDFKSASTYMFKQISKANSALELANSDFIWVRHYPVQMLMYDDLYQHECGLLFFKDKDRGYKHIVPVPVDKTFTKQVFSGLEEVNEYVEKRRAPKPVYVDACKWCEFCSTVCFKEGQPAKESLPRLTDAELELKLMRKEEIKAIAKEHDSLDKEIKEQLRGFNGFVGDFQITSKEYEASIFNVPDDIKQQYKESQKRTRMTIKFLGGAL